MFPGLLAAALLAAAPVRGPVLLVTPGLAAKHAPKVAVTYAENALSRSLQDAGVQLALPEHVEQRLGAEARKRLLGCDLQTPACLEALKAATQADAVLTGQLEQVKEGYVVQLQVRLASTGEVLVQDTASGFGMAELEAGLGSSARKLAPLLSLRVGAPLKPYSRARTQALVPAGAGLALVSVGTVFLLSARSTHSQLVYTDSSSAPSATEALQLVSRGKRQQLLGGVFMGAGLAAGGVAAYLFLRDEKRKPSNPLGMTLLPTHRGFAVAGVLP